MQNEMTLHGLLVGLGVEHKDGSKDFRWLEKPIHNKIVACGLDAYFQLNGSNTATTTTSPYQNRFLGYSESARQIGLLRFFAIGTSGTSTQFEDTSLISQVGGFSNAYSFTVLPYFGFRRNADDSASIRVQSTSIAVDSPTTVREMGWFEKYSGTDTYVMFSRVVLDSPVSLETGDKLLACYQIDINFASMSETEVPSSLLSGLLDSDGNQLRAFQSQRIIVYNGANVGVWRNGNDATPSFPGIGYYYSYGICGSATNASAIGWTFNCPFYKSSSPDDSSSIRYNTQSDFALLAQWSSSSSYSRYNFKTDGNHIESYDPIDYVPGTYYRDRKIVTSPAWPNFSSGTQDIYAINYSNLVMRFGHFDTTDPDNPVWVPKPWRKEYGKRYEFIYRLKLSTVDTP